MLRQDVVTRGLAVVFSFSQDAKNVLLFPGIISSIFYFGRFDEENCAYYITWDTRAACAVKQQEVEVVNGTVINPATGKNFSLGDVYYKWVKNPKTTEW